MLPKYIAAGLASVNIAGVLGLGWFVAGMFTYDGVMIFELSICAGLMVLLSAITAGGVALKRGGRTRTAIALLSVGAVPTLFIYGFLVYLEFNPIDWR